MLLHYHQDLSDKLDMEYIGSEYVSKNDTMEHLHCSGVSKLFCLYVE